ncbi:hypothetical protein [Nitrosomonas sp. Nm132]|uniref:hypothetical protein n=1 Tax=Nitrosomonas sp. Nm132 TaxID=1881053 RepID=UPI00087F24B0|nr:hypothetical protein [Nitrosomonas sp. Nm132]SDH05965.1 hypothetical protein SAMN05428952_1004124 [Nitrosomonas sp. Nm132]
MTFNKKAIFGVILALLVGGLGNGVWEYVLKPVFTWSLAGILNIATLGVHAFKDDLYREIAKGFHEESSLSLANALYYWVGYGVVFGLFLLTRKTKDMASRIVTANQDLDNLEAIVEGRAAPSEPKADLQVRISNLRTSTSELVPKVQLMQKAVYLLFALGIAFFAWMIIGNAKDRYINSAIVHYEQSISIVTPMATDKELAAFKSRFARVASKGDYEALISDIAHVGDRDDLKVPDFKAW